MRFPFLIFGWLLGATALAQQAPLPATDLSAGMVFVFEENAAHCMWMKNTLMPLSVAFIDEAGVIINIADMQPHSEESHCAAKPARYALEMNKGWFAQRGIKPGAKLGGLEKISPR